MALQIHETTANSIIGNTKVPSAGFVINPYTGCQFACMYCFASFMGRFVGETNGNWGDYVYVKTNAVELMEKQNHRLLKKDPHPRIAISTVTDPYQGVERKYRLTRGILNTFAEHDYQGRVSILTKSPTVLDGLETLKRIKIAEVRFSITTSDDALRRKLDAKAPFAHARLDTVKALIDAGGILRLRRTVLAPYVTATRANRRTVREYPCHQRDRGESRISQSAYPEFDHPVILRVQRKGGNASCKRGIEISRSTAALDLRRPICHRGSCLASTWILTGLSLTKVRLNSPSGAPKLGN